MLSTDSTILQILIDAKKNGNRLLQYFNISAPNNQISQESNSIFVANVSSESDMSGFDFQNFTDLVEVLIVTKRRNYEKATKIIKTVSKEICKLILENHDKFPNKPLIRNINPEFNRDYVLTRGHIMIQVKTEPFSFNNTDESIENVCKILAKDIRIE